MSVSANIKEIEVIPTPGNSNVVYQTPNIYLYYLDS